MGVGEGRPGFSGKGTSTGAEETAQPRRKLSNRVGHAVLGSKQLAMAKEQVSVGIGEVGCGRHFYSFLGKLWAMGTYRLEIITQFRA